MARPAFTPTSEQRNIVRSMAGMGIRHEDIALKIGIRSPKTMRKHFRQELKLSAVEANYKVEKTLFQMATSGKCPAATIFWAKTRNRPREDPHTDRMPVAPPPFIVEREQEGGRQ
jgi:hypothetical protein